MAPSRRARQLASLLGFLAALAIAVWQRSPATPPAAPTAQPVSDGLRGAAPALRTRLEGVTVTSYGEAVLRGTVDLAATVERIREGGSHPHRNDGAVFENRERRLPVKPSGYYREYVHPTPGIRGAGPQRVIVGRGGEWYYTPDHYQTFRALN